MTKNEKKVFVNFYLKFLISIFDIFFILISDEEDENDQLLFLTITPEFDEVDENTSKSQQQVY